MKTILLPTDYSKNAWNAIFTALKLFYDEQCQFVLLHTYEPELSNVLGDEGRQSLGSIYASLEEDSNTRMAELMDYLKEHHPNPRHSFKAVVRPGNLVGEVRARMKKHPVDLIAMGTKGATGAERVLLGSNTVRMLKSIQDKPILAVPGQFDFQRLKNVVFPTDYMHYYEPFELQPLIDLVRDWKAKLHVAYAAREFDLNPTQDSNKALLNTRLAGLDVRHVEIPLEKHLSDAIRDYGDKIRADLIALVQHKHGLLESITREKVVKRIAFDSHVPLLILPKFL